MPGGSLDSYSRSQLVSNEATYWRQQSKLKKAPEVAVAEKSVAPVSSNMQHQQMWPAACSTCGSEPRLQKSGAPSVKAWASTTEELLFSLIQEARPSLALTLLLINKTDMWLPKSFVDVSSHSENIGNTMPN